MYKENPKTKGSGIICCIPHNNMCPVNCHDCFFNSGRSYLEPIKKNLPNMPHRQLTKNRIVRVNDGNDSSVKREVVINTTKKYKNKFYNTSFKFGEDDFDAPVVLTLNPAQMTDHKWHVLITIPKNLMFVRIRVNTWNIKSVVEPAIKYYTNKKVPVVLTFMAYYTESIPRFHKHKYEFRKRTVNSYWCLKSKYWEKIIDKYKDNMLVYSCGIRYGKTISCKYCGNCLREYYSTMEKLKWAR